MQWSKFSSEKYTRNMSYHYSVICQKLTCVIQSIPKLLLTKYHSWLLINFFLLSDRPEKKTSKKISCVKLPDDVKAAHSTYRTAFGSWKNHDFPSVCDIHDTYCCSHKEYRLLMCNFLNNLENDKVTKLHNAAESDEKLFWNF